MNLRQVALGEAAHLTVPMELEMSRLYEVGNAASPITTTDFEPPVGIFLIASVDEVDVACGGLRLLAPGIGEVKRMYVDPAYRGRGLSRALLRALLDHARSVGLREAWLETGVRQPAAIALYESEGFVPREAFGHFADEPESRSFCLSLS